MFHHKLNDSSLQDAINITFNPSLTPENIVNEIEKSQEFRIREVPKIITDYSYLNIPENYAAEYLFVSKVQKRM